MSDSKLKKKGLGRGFDALIPEHVDTSLLLGEHERIEKLEIHKVSPSADQPRQHFDERALTELADSIRQYGILQPLVVTPGKAGTYAIIAGERRWRAAGIAGLHKVPAVVRTTKDLERLELALIENVQRVDLSPLEQAASIERLHQQFNVTYEQIAKRLSKASSTVNNLVRLLQLPEAAAKALRQKKITEGHARAVLALKGVPQKQKALLESILKHGWTVRQAEQFVSSVKQGHKEAIVVQKRMRTQTPQTKNLSKRLGGAPVHVRRTARGGKLEIAFSNDDDLANIFERLSQ